jgi:hypothetical protein
MTDAYYLFLLNEETGLLKEKEAIRKKIRPIEMKHVAERENSQGYFYAPKNPEQIKDVNRLEEIEIRLAEIRKSLSHYYSPE